MKGKNYIIILYVLLFNLLVVNYCFADEIKDKSGNIVIAENISINDYVYGNFSINPRKFFNYYIVNFNDVGKYTLCVTNYAHIKLYRLDNTNSLSNCIFESDSYLNYNNGTNISKYNIENTGIYCIEIMANILNISENLNYTLYVNSSDSITPLQSISLDTKQIQLQYYPTNGIVTLNATPIPFNATISKLTWTSDNPSIATVDENGLVTAISSGKAIIKAITENGCFATCEVNVEPIHVTGVRIYGDGSFTFNNSYPIPISVVVIPNNADNKTIRWNSSNPDIISIKENTNNNSEVYLVPLSEGNSLITATSVDNPDIHDGFVVAVPEIIHVNGAYFDKKESIQFKSNGLYLPSLNILPNNAFNKQYSYTCDNDEIIDINTPRKIISPGECIITATTKDGGYTDTCKITILPDPPAQFTNWSVNTNTPSNKMWTIKFNKSVKEDSIKNNIYVTDTHLKYIPTNVNINDNIVTITPIDNYTSGETYYLYILKDIAGNNSKQLNDNIRMIFRIK